MISNKKILPFLALFSLFLLANSPLHAQFTVTGMAVDGEGNPLPYLTVHKKGTVDGVVADQEGKFSITLKKKRTLVFSYVGLKSIAVKVDRDTSLRIVMNLNSMDVILIHPAFSYWDRTEFPFTKVLKLYQLNLNEGLSLMPILNNTSGLHMYSGALNTNRITIRGMGSRSPFATTKVKAYLDDIPLTTGDGETTIEDIDLSLLSKATVWKGPTQSRYGAGLGGMIQLESRKNDAYNFLKSEMTLGAFGLIRNASTLGFYNSKHRLKISANFNVTHSDGYRDNNQYDRQGATVFAKKTSKRSAVTTLLANFTQLKSFIPSSLNREDYENEPKKAAFSWAAVKGNEDYNKLLLGLSHTRKIVQKKYFSLYNQTSIFFSMRDAYETRPFNILDENSKAMGFRTRFYTLKYKGMELNAGMEFFNEDYIWKTFESNGGTAGELLSDNAEDRTYFNVFLEAKKEIGKLWLLEGGFNLNSTRYRYKDLFQQNGIDRSAARRFDLVPSPRLKVIHRVFDKKASVFALISHGFSAPSLEETLYPDGSINPDIAAEKGWNFELGILGGIPSTSLKYSIAGHSMLVKDLLVAERVGPDQYVGVNAGKTLHNGLELELKSHFVIPRIKNNIKIKPSINYTLSRYKFLDFKDGNEDYSGNPLTGIAPHKLNIDLHFVYNLQIYADVHFQWVSAYPLRDDNSIDTDPYQLVNLNVGYKREFNDRFELDVALGINNLFNEKYASMAQINAGSFGGADPRYYYPGLPLHFYGRVGVRYRFGK